MVETCTAETAHCMTIVAPIGAGDVGQRFSLSAITVVTSTADFWRTPELPPNMTSRTLNLSVRPSQRVSGGEVIERVIYRCLRGRE